MGGHVLLTEGCRMIRPQSVQVGDLEDLDTDVKILLKQRK